MKPGREFLKGCTETIVLALLSERQMYGYELTQEIRRRSDGIFAPPEGTIYPLLYTLERKGLVEGVWEDGPSGGARRRKYYRLTKEGKAMAQEDLSQWADLVKGMQSILGGGHAPGR